MSQVDRRDRRNALTDPMRIERALLRAVEDAVRQHKRAGNSIAVWQDGQVKIVPAMDIVVANEVHPQ